MSFDKRFKVDLRFHIIWVDVFVDVFEKLSCEKGEEKESTWVGDEGKF